MSARAERLLDAIGEVQAARRPGGDARRADHVFAVALLALFLLALLGAVAVGTSVYQRLNERSDAAAEARSPLGVVVNAVRATDAEGSVTRAAGPEGDALVLVERLDTGTYETRFFLADGWLVQQYAVEGSPVSTQGATRLAASGSFSFELDDGLLTVSCDAGTARVALRSGGES
ncbi:MAG TPA: DUF4860 domain-containing protein [Candidatus Olsenella avistercoris]|nr:DUF4860 domain-containing protein [Candidatus Olsenella avistercoris]